MNSKSGLILTLLTALFLTACAKNKPDVVAVPEGDGANTAADAYDPSTSNPWGVPGYSENDLRNLFNITQNPLNYRVVLFEYNSSRVDERSEIIINAHARHLSQTGGTQVTLEGHADERGTRDFNLALGERRAQEVSRLLTAGGAGSGVQTISYGEERPVDTGHSESAWSQNRRVAINY